MFKDSKERLAEKKLQERLGKEVRVVPAVNLWGKRHCGQKTIKVYAYEPKDLCSGRGNLGEPEDFLGTYRVCACPHCKAVWQHHCLGGGALWARIKP